MLNIKCNKTTFTFLQASLNLQFEGSHWLIFHMHFHYIWRWKLYGCIGGTRRRDGGDTVAEGMVPAPAAPAAWYGDVRVIHFKRLDYKVGDGFRIHPTAPPPPSPQAPWWRTLHGGSPIHQLIDEFSFVTFRELSMIDPKSFFNSSWNM